MESELLKQFKEDGFVIVPQVIPPDRLEDLRTQFEVSLERQKVVWAKNRGPEDPPGGVWETSVQPRPAIQDVVEPDTAETVEFFFHGNIMSVNRELLGGQGIAPKIMYMMCNPVRDRGPDRWHFDIHPDKQPPIGGLQKDLQVNGPANVQWNIALYDDSVFWVVPGSHRRPMTDEENHCLLESLREPLPTGTPVDLKAGDGVVYTNTIQHWGSDYSSRLRRTLLVNYRSFGGSAYALNPQTRIWNLDFTEHLSPGSRNAFKRSRELLEDELDRVTSTYRALIARDEPAFREGLDALHPAKEEQIVCVALLERLAKKIRFDPNGPCQVWSQFEEIAGRFTLSEIETMWQRFETLDEKLQSGAKQYVSGFQSEPARLCPYDMPADYDVEDFIAGWKN